MGFKSRRANTPDDRVGVRAQRQRRISASVAEEVEAFGNAADRPVEDELKADPRRTTESAKVQVTAYMRPEVRNRARAAFKFTAALEGDSSWSEYVESAVLAETLRREQQHNNGQPYDGGEQRLSPGRSIT